MTHVIAVAVSLFFAIAMTLASPVKFKENLKRNRILVPVLWADAVYLVISVVLYAMALQLTPAISYTAASILCIVTFFAALIGSVRNVGVYVIAGLLSLFFVFVTVIALPEDYTTKEFEGEEYIGVAQSNFDHKYIYYYKSKFPLIISYNYDYSEYYGMGTVKDSWAEITKDGPVEINYYEDGRLVRTKPIYPWTK